MATQAKGKAVEPDVTVFPKAEQVSINEMSTEEFYARYADFRRLMVHQDGLIALAGSVSGDCDELLAAVKAECPEIPERMLIYWTGPADLNRIADATADE